MLISKSLIDSCIIHDEFVWENEDKRMWGYERSQKLKIFKIFTLHKKWSFP